MGQCFMVTLVGKDQPGIVARVTRALFDGGCNLGAASMVRLGDNFTVMLTVDSIPTVNAEQVRRSLKPVVEAMALHAHVDAIDGPINRVGKPEPDCRVTVYGADRPGIVANVTEVLAALKFNILDLETDVSGSEQELLYLLHIEGQCDAPENELRAALDGVRKNGVDVRVTSIQTLVG